LLLSGVLWLSAAQVTLIEQWPRMNINQITCEGWLESNVFNFKAFDIKVEKT
jgi:hypothetical protein